MSCQSFQACFYEAFEEEAAALREALGPELAAQCRFTPAAIQEDAEWLSETTPGPAARLQGASATAALPAPIISVRTQSVIPVEWAQNGQLRAILTRSTGYDHIRRYLAALPAHKRPLAGYLPLYCARAVAEQAMLLWTALLRRLPQQLSQFANFHRDGITGRENLGKTLSVFGVGNIGRQVADIGKGLGMNVLGVDIVERHDTISYVDPETAFREGHILVSAMNLTEDNRGYFTSEQFTRCRPGTLFVNISRGELSPAPTLLECLEKGQLGGVALDVFNEEPAIGASLREEGQPGGAAGQNGVSRVTLHEAAAIEMAAIQRLIDHPCALLTPHNAFNTEEAVERKAGQSAEQLRLFLRDGRFDWPVDV